MILVYWLLTAMIFLFIGWMYESHISYYLSKSYMKLYVLIIFLMFTLAGIYGCFMGEQVMFLEFNRDRNDTTLTTCFETPPVTRFEYNYNCGDGECAILYYDCDSENSTIQHFVYNETTEMNETAGLEITSISWEP